MKVPERDLQQLLNIYSQVTPNAGFRAVTLRRVLEKSLAHAKLFIFQLLPKAIANQ